MGKYCCWVCASSTGRNALNGIRGIIDVTPAACSFSTTNVESLEVLAPSEVCAGMVSTTGVTPTRLRSGSR